MPGCGDGFVGEEGGDEVAEKCLSVRRLAAEMAVFQGSAGHGADKGKRGEGLGGR